MKIGILTFHRANNFGAFLQAFALCKKLNLMDNVSAEIIDYVCPAIENEYDSKHLLAEKGNPLKKRAVYLLRKSTINETSKKFNMARYEFIPTGDKDIKRENLNGLQSIYDLFIVGSDQVWNEDLTLEDKSYFLDFVEDNSKKCSYAVSMGQPAYTENQLLNLKELVQKFSHLSVREQSSADFLKKLTGREDIAVSVDPVFLLNMDIWEMYIKRPQISDYILYYTVGIPRETTLNFAKELAKSRNKKLLFVRDRDIPYKHLEVQHINGIDPMDFAGYVYNANCIVTNSFHATAFSILFHKDFYVETKMKRSERMLNLLNTAGIKSHKLFDGELIDKDQIEIDWKSVDGNLAGDIDSSLQYLKGVVGVL